MKNEKGITLATLLIYVVAMTIVVGIIAVVLNFYSNNVVGMNNVGEINLELNKFEAKMIQETQTANNQIIEISEDRIEFSNGNIYTFENNCIFQNAVIVSSSVKEFSARVEQEAAKQILRVYILLGKGQVEVAKNLSYVIELTGDNNQMALTKIIKKIPYVDENGLAKENVIIKPSTDSNIQIVIPEGFAPVILNGSNTTTSDPGEDGSVKAIIPAEEWENITIEQINKGIVVVDHSITATAGVPDYNEYVWVSIPTSTDFARVAWTINGTQQILAETSTANAFWEDKTSTEYINMVSSVNKNKGFYISRYEASNNGNDIAQSKRGQLPWAQVTQTVAITACATNNIINTHLMYGIEWDSVLNWLIEKATIGTSTSGQTKTMERSDITDSSSWGNYNNSTGNAATNRGSRRNTGYSEYWKANNIYDLAGNVEEWIQENYSTDNRKNCRGSDYNHSGKNYPAAYRYISGVGSIYVDRRFPL